MTEQEQSKSGRIVDLGDVFGLAGAGLASYGTWLIYPPAAFIFSGVILMAMAAAMAFKKAHS